MVLLAILNQKDLIYEFLRLYVFFVYVESDVVLRIKPVNTRKLKVKKEKKIKKCKKPRRRYKRRVLSDSEKLQASRRRRTCLVKKPKSDFLGVSW